MRAKARANSAFTESLTALGMWLIKLADASHLDQALAADNFFSLSSQLKIFLYASIRSNLSSSGI